MILGLILLFFSAIIYLNCCRRRPEFIFTGHIFYSLSTKILSIIMLDFTSQYNFEIGEVTHFNGSSIIFTLFSLIVMSSIYLYSEKAESLSRIKIQKYNQKSKLNSLLILFCVVVLILHYINLAISDVPLFNSTVDRWNFYTEYSKFSIMHSIFGKVLVFVPFLLGVHYALSNRKINILLFLILIVYMVLVGQKINGLFVISFYFIAPILFKYFYLNLKIKITLKQIIYSIIFLFIFILIVKSALINRSFGGLYVDNDISGKFFYRVYILNSGFIWASYDYYFHYGVLSNLDLLLNKSNIYELIFTNLNYIEKNRNYGGFIFFTILLNYGVIAFLISAFIYIIFFIHLLRKIKKSFFHSNYLALIFGAYLLFYFSSSLSMTNLDMLFITKTIIFYLLFIFSINFRIKF